MKFILKIIILFFILFSIFILGSLLVRFGPGMVKILGFIVSIASIIMCYRLLISINNDDQDKKYNPETQQTKENERI